MILFDLGGVLVDASFEELARLLALAHEPESLRARWLACSAVRDFERGVIDVDAFASRMVEEWRLDMSPQAFADLFAGWPRGPYACAAELVARVRARHRVGCFSNCNALHWPRFAPFLAGFDVAISSHHIGRVKPDAESFEAALAAAGAQPRETWFFDDSPSNVEAASALGMRAFLVRGIAQLEEALQREGLLSPNGGGKGAREKAPGA